MTIHVPKQLIVESQSAIKPGHIPGRVVLFNPDGTPLLIVQTTAAMVLTGYTVAEAVAAISATDTLNVALGKLQKSINDLDTRVDALEAA